MKYDYNAALEALNEKPRSVIFYHNNCSDGITSAILMGIQLVYHGVDKNTPFSLSSKIIEAIRENLVFVPYDYAEEELDDVVYAIMRKALTATFVDIVPSIGVIEKYNTDAMKPGTMTHPVCIYDHHASSIKKLHERYPIAFECDITEHSTTGVETTAVCIGSFILRFPTKEDTLSAAGMMALRMRDVIGDDSYLVDAMVKIGMLVSDRDLWHFNLPHSKALYYAFGKFGYFAPVTKSDDFENKLIIFFGIMHDLDTVLGGYQILVDGIEESVRNNVDAYATVIYVGPDFFWTSEEGNTEPTLKVMLCAMPYGNASYAGEYMYTECGADIAITYQDDPKNSTRRLSIRTDKKKQLPNGINAAALAIELGGGGHDHAAGVKCNINAPFSSLYATIGNAVRSLLAEEVVETKL